jgi:flavin-dependent dehydrogenase
MEVYVTPVGSCEANVAVLARRSRMREMAGDPGEAVREHAERLLGPAELIDRPLAAGPFDRRCTRPWRGNLLLVGDAAGFLDGISGEGMSAALLGAEQAVAAIDAVLDGEEPPVAFARYGRRRAALVRDSNLMSRLALLISRDPRLARFAIANLQRRPATFARLVAVNAGELPLSSLRPRDALGLALGI